MIRVDIGGYLKDESGKFRFVRFHFTLFCLYALSGYVYQLWLFINDKPNPVLPGEYAPAEEVPAQADQTEVTKTDDKGPSA